MVTSQQYRLNYQRLINYTTSIPYRHNNSSKFWISQILKYIRQLNLLIKNQIKIGGNFTLSPTTNSLNNNFLRSIYITSAFSNNLTAIIDFVLSKIIH